MTPETAEISFKISPYALCTCTINDKHCNKIRKIERNFHNACHGVEQCIFTGWVMNAFRCLIIITFRKLKLQPVVFLILHFPCRIFLSLFECCRANQKLYYFALVFSYGNLLDKTRSWNPLLQYISKYCGIYC